MLSRLIALVSTLLLIGCASIPPQPSEALADKRKNIVFIVVDDLGWADIGALNRDMFYETPNIDRLAAKGALFTDAYAASPVCSPTRVALMTGKHPTRLATTDWFHRPGSAFRAERFRPAEIDNFLKLDETTMAEALRGEGYRTAFLGKWHMGNEEAYWPENQGFEINIGGNNWGKPPGGFFSPYENPRLEDGPDGEYLTERLTSEAINLLDSFAAGDDPFLLYMSYYTVHTPLEAPKATVAKYEAKGAGTRGEDDFAPEVQHLATDEPRMVRIEQNHAIYAAMIEELDRNVGRLMVRLEQADLADDTIIVFTSDNGGLSTAEGSPTSNLPLRGGKGWLYEGGVRVPLIVYDPAIANGRAISEPVISMDLMPTLFELAGAARAVPSDIDGRSFVASILGKNLPQAPLFFHYPHYSNQGGQPGAAVRLGEYKLIQNFEDGSVELFDLENDPGERRNLASTDPARASAMTQMLGQWYRETGARFLRPLEEDGARQPWSPEPAR